MNAVPPGQASRKPDNFLAAIEVARPNATPPPQNESPPDARQQPRARSKEQGAVETIAQCESIVNTAEGSTSGTAESSGADQQEPDVVAAQRFLDLLAPGEAITFQTFDDTKRKRKELARIRHGHLDEHGAELLRLNQQGAGIYWTVNRTDLKGRCERNIVGVRALFVDLDGAPIDPVVRAAAAPDVIVESSPGRFHAYWRIADCPLDQFTALQKALAAKFNGDLKVSDLPRVLRVPGFLHRKAAPFLARLVRP